MSLPTFEARMDALVSAFGDGRHREAADLAAQLKAELLAEAAAAGKQPDPMQVGWARFYQLKALHAAPDYAAAHALLSSTEPVTWIVSQRNAAWMDSVGVELAFRLGKADEIAVWGERCYQKRVELGDPKDVAACVHMVHDLLGRVGRADEAAAWAERLRGVAP